jgi:hypothetical protein
MHIGRIKVPPFTPQQPMRYCSSILGHSERLAWGLLSTSMSTRGSLDGSSERGKKVNQTAIKTDSRIPSLGDLKDSYRFLWKNMGRKSLQFSSSALAVLHF